jgi:hypothetical protein
MTGDGRFERLDFECQMNDIRENIRLLAVDSRRRNQELRELMAEQAREFRAADKVLAERIESLVSAIGQFIAKQ